MPTIDDIVVAISSGDGTKLLLIMHRSICVFCDLLHVTAYGKYIIHY